MENKSEIIIYNTNDGEASIALMTKEGTVWMNQNQLAELFATSVTNISTHISKILNNKELDTSSVVKYYLSTASDGEDYVINYSEFATIKTN
jgi:hypothetical protein